MICYSINNIVKVLYKTFFSVFVLLILASCSSNISSTKDFLELINSNYSNRWKSGISYYKIVNFYYKKDVIANQIQKVNYNIETGFSNKSITQNIADSTKKFNVFKLEKDLNIFSKEFFHNAPDVNFKYFSELKYNINKFCINKINDSKVFVIGDENNNQLLYDAKNLYLLKIIKFEPEGKYEILLKDHIKIENDTWIEQNVDVKLNNELIISEKYFNIQLPILFESISEKSVKNETNIISTENYLNIIVIYGSKKIADGIYLIYKRLL
jgi:hypothetical protein